MATQDKVGLIALAVVVPLVGIYLAKKAGWAEEKQTVGLIESVIFSEVDPTNSEQEVTMLNQKVQAQIEEVMRKSWEKSAVTITLGSTMRCSVNWTNIGASGVRDLAAYYGHGAGITDPDDFVVDLGGEALMGVYLAAGVTRNSDIDVVLPINADIAIGTWDVLVCVGLLNAQGTLFDVLDDWRVVPNAVTIVAPIPTARGRINNVSFSQV